MKLLDRYLKSVGWWLPKGQREDILAELSEDIRSQIDDRQIELGRELSDDEVAAILERLGRPEVVAQRYLPQSYLIGPAMFPLYRFVLKLVLLVYLVPGLLVWLSLAIFDSSYRAAHPGFGLLGGLESLWHTALSAFTFITVGFALVEWSRAQAGKPKEWGARELPEVRDEDRIPRSESLGELAGHLVFLLWWLDVLPSPSVPDLRLTLAPIWHTLSWPILLLALAGAALADVNLVHPYWTRRRAAVSLAIDSASVVLLLLLLRAGTLIEVALPGQPMATLEDVAKLELSARWINLSMAVTLAVIAVLCAIGGVRAARRLWGRGKLLPLARQSL
jgi:HAAS domain-containing protein